MAAKREAKTSMDVAHGFTELENIASWFEEGKDDLDEGLKKFERAMTIAQALKKRLDEAEQTIRDMKGAFSHSSDEQE
jgi:exodeoxyribonuclease VII small subunit